MGVANNKVYRFVPRRNDDVNDTWLCDAGRLSYGQIGSGDRLRSPLVRAGEGPAEPTGYDAALTEAAERLQRVVDETGAGSVVALASPHATNEDLFTFHRFAKALGVGAAGVAVVSGDDDDLLIKAEKAANAVGARAIGFEDAAGALEKIRGGEASAAVVMGHDLLDEAHLGDAKALGGLQALIVLDTHQSALQKVAHVSFPVRHAAEKLGTLTNHAGRVQCVRPALEPAWEAWTEGEVIAKLGAALGLEGFDGCYDVHGVSKLLAEANPAFAGVHLGSVGDQGRLLAGAGEAVEGEQP
jgi:NADH-quinone oxidoreductase subunit G